MKAIFAFTLALLSAVWAPAFGRSAMETDVLGEVNYLRTNPLAYARQLDDYATRFEGNLAFGDNDEPDMQTREGVRAVSEAARAMRRARPMNEMRHSDVLAQAAADHVANQGRTGQVGHMSNGKDPGARVKARGGNIYVGEVIAYGVHGARNAVRQLIVDDGVPHRGHRKLLLFAPYRYAGVACGPHRAWRNMCVIVLSETRDGSPAMSPVGS
ncbi:MAG: CAP domain-containing protein [Sphingomonadaceae bacterium]|nr:CAP domain-containing protein [Sphingomonadaceae bacterium]